MVEQQGKNSESISSVSVAGLAVLVALFSYLGGTYFGPIRESSAWLDDFRLTYLTPLAEQNQDVVVLAITEDTIATLPYRSPVDREFLANLVNRLNEKFAVRAIGIDLIFDQPTVERNDSELQAAMRRSSVPLVVAAGEATAGLSQPQLAFQDNYLAGIETGSSILRTENGVVRTHFPGGAHGDRRSFVASLAATIGLDLPGAPQPILFRRAARDFGNAIRVFPAHNVDMLPEDWLHGKVVLVGAVLSDRDQHRTPLSVLGGTHEYMPGVLIHAQILAQTITGARVPQVSAFATFVVLAFAISVGLTLALAPLSPVQRILTGIGFLVAYWVAAFSTSVYWRFPLPVLIQSIAYVLAMAGATAIARQKERRQRVFLHRAFNRYVSPEIIDDLLKNPEHLRLGGDSREMSFIFTDIAGFSTMSEHLPPATLVSLLSGYLDGLITIALAHKGTIARFVGDGLIVFFGAPLPQESHRKQAVACALEFDRFCEEYRHHASRQQFGFGLTRIGVHSGLAIVGNVGGNRRFEYTAHGDCVNVAARLESANRWLGTRLCMSTQSVADFPAADYQPVGDLILKGKTQAVSVVTRWDDYTDLDRVHYLDAYAMMSRGDVRCAELFGDLMARRPNDPLLAFQISRSNSSPPSVEYRMLEK